MCGYAQASNERLGNVDFIVENTGNIPLVFQLRHYDGSTSPSGYTYTGAGAWVTVAAKGKRTVGYTLLAKRVGFFGSGVAATVTVNGVSQYVTSTTANISVAIANKGDLTGRQVDLCAAGRQGWAYDAAFQKASLNKKWGVSHAPGAFGVSSIDPTTEGV